MSDLIATIFVHPVSFPWAMVPWFAIPLCVAVGVVYKTLTVENLSALPWAIVKFAIYTILGLVAISVAATIVYSVLL